MTPHISSAVPADVLPSTFGPCNLTKAAHKPSSVGERPTAILQSRLVVGRKAGPLGRSRWPGEPLLRTLGGSKLLEDLLTRHAATRSPDEDDLTALYDPAPGPVQVGDPDGALEKQRSVLWVSWRRLSLKKSLRGFTSAAMHLPCSLAKP